MNPNSSVVKSFTCLLSDWLIELDVTGVAAVWLLIQSQKASHRGEWRCPIQTIPSARSNNHVREGPYGGFWAPEGGFFSSSCMPPKSAPQFVPVGTSSQGTGGMGIPDFVMLTVHFSNLFVYF